MYPVIEIFDSIEGEGIRQGLPATFVRLSGCNLHCTYCDTAYAQTEKPTLMPIHEIMKVINPGFLRCTLTGGEPLLHPQAVTLINALTSHSCEVNIETNGAVDIRTCMNELTHPNHVIFTIDYKLPASGMTEHMIWDNFVSLRPTDVIKFVIGSEDDTAVMLHVLKRLAYVYEEGKHPHIYLGVVFGRYENKKLAECMLKEPLLRHARLQLQLHKQIWNPEERGV